MKTTEQIAARVKELADGPDDFLGFQRSDLIPFLSFEQAKPFLKDTATAEDWGEQRIATEESIKTEMEDYMDFAWEKANNCRGISAHRSVEHYKAWLWLLDDDLCESFDDTYEYYGKPCLRAICEKYGWDWRQWDDGKWRNDERDDGIPAPV